PHHEAQKSTKTGTFAAATISSNAPASTSSGSLAGRNLSLQVPHRPTSAKCFAGTRFFDPQDSQGRMTEKDIFTTSTRLAACKVTLCHLGPPIASREPEGDEENTTDPAAWPPGWGTRRSHVVKRRSSPGSGQKQVHCGRRGGK